VKINPEKLGQNIKYLRKTKGISQENLAYLSQIRLSNLAKLEGGFNSNPTLATLSAIANVLTNGSIDQLVK
jgi:transcriptional regulator with XRE-family HTH domain